MCLAIIIERRHLSVSLVDLERVHCDENLNTAVKVSLANGCDALSQLREDRARLVVGAGLL